MDGAVSMAWDLIAGLAVGALILFGAIIVVALGDDDHDHMRRPN